MRQHRRPLGRRRSYALHRAALLIDRDQDRRAGRRRSVDRAVEIDQRVDVRDLLRDRRATRDRRAAAGSRDLARARDRDRKVALEHHHRADVAVGDLAQQLGRRAGAVEPDPQQLADVARESGHLQGSTVLHQSQSKYGPGPHANDVDASAYWTSIFTGSTDVSVTIWLSSSACWITA